MKTTKDINLFSYLDYRKFLVDFYKAAKKTRAGFSLRSFSQKAGFGSSNFYKLVMDGDRNLTESSAKKFAKGLKLNKQEIEFFIHLVHFTQAKSHEEKNDFYQKLLKSKRYNQLKPLAKEQYDFYSKWYHAVVRELITSNDFNGSLVGLAKKIHPEITLKEVQESIEILTNLGFVEEDSCGKYKARETLITTGPECDSVILMNYHKHLLQLIKEQLDDIPSTQRDVSALTLGIKKELLPIIKQKVQQFRKEILEMVSEETDAEDVIALTIQLWPLTKTWE